MTPFVHVIGRNFVQTCILRMASRLQCETVFWWATSSLRSWLIYAALGWIVLRLPRMIPSSRISFLRVPVTVVS